MSLSERYKSNRKKRIRRFFAFYLFFAYIVIFYNSFARYVATTENTPKMEVASWKIHVNGNNISKNDVDENTLSNIISLVPNGNGNTTDNKLAPGQSGYFDIIINPEGTEVALEYTITIDKSNIPEAIVLNSYEIVEDGLTQNFTEDYTVSGTIDLVDNTEQLTENESKTVRIKWEWPADANSDIPTGEESYDISATVYTQQKIAN